MSDCTYAKASHTRRSFLSVTTAAGAAASLGTAGWGLFGSLSPSADVTAEMRGIEVKLSDIPDATELAVNYSGNPAFVRHRTKSEIEPAESVSRQDYWDTRTFDVFGRDLGSAEDSLRRATPDGRFIALIGTPEFCVVTPYVADWNGWFDPCRGGHCDTSGRSRLNADNNMRLQVFELIDDNTLLLIENPAYVPKAVREGLL